MTEDAALPLMLVFGLASVLLVRSREVVWWQAGLIFLFGIYAALTPIVYTVTGLVQWLLQRFTA
ncbi:hypothetical protein ACIBKZ_13250 [Streptomyces sp. NPDC050421]|uniref:Uncharacterized protein n=1 Tax=Streptomyces laculatispora TaxID=887464 RepID=A0ABY9HY87_9ACTN|nr:hypothetical protein [Streptomyces laculatispora]WLQ39369.1 hypothetical protein P8A22_04585 [Streptomyces laculatispora]